MYGGPLREKWNQLSEESRKRTFPVQTLSMYDSLFVIYMYLYRSETLLWMLLAVPFIEIGGKQKNTIASVCDKKEIL